MFVSVIIWATVTTYVVGTAYHFIVIFGDGAFNKKVMTEDNIKFRHVLISAAAIAIAWPLVLYLYKSNRQRA